VLPFFRKSIRQDLTGAGAFIGVVERIVGGVVSTPAANMQKHGMGSGLDSYKIVVGLSNSTEELVKQ
jgi:hypothetical protein